MFRELAHPLARHIARLMIEKKTNLTLSADVNTMGELLEVAHELGPHIVVLKTHIDCIEDFSYTQVKQLKALAKKHRFLIFEDRKFADIGHTAQRQFTGGIYRIADWADLINAHGICGSTQIESLKACVDPRECGLLLIANMSPERTLFTPEYSQRVIELAMQHQDFVCGFISPRLRVPDVFLNFSPGIHLNASSDTKGQRYDTPQDAMAFGVDSLIVGRGILEAADRTSAARSYHLKFEGVMARGIERSDPKLAKFTPGLVGET